MEYFVIRFYENSNANWFFLKIGPKENQCGVTLEFNFMSRSVGIYRDFTAT